MQRFQLFEREMSKLLLKRRIVSGYPSIQLSPHISYFTKFNYLPGDKTPEKCFHKDTWRRFSSSNFSHSSTKRQFSHGLVVAAACGAFGLAWYVTSNQNGVHCKEADDKQHKAGKRISGLPNYRKTEVLAHKTPKTGIWVTFGDGVYDITEFVEGHPGGDKILLAAGGQLEPFWDMYAVHKNEDVFEMLEGLRIGNLHPDDKVPIPRNPNDPYSGDPPRHPALKVNSEKPFNAETPPQLLTDNFLTPNELFFVRNHLPVPKIDMAKFKLEVQREGGKKPIKFTLDELKSKFKTYTVTATVQCAGNRRTHMSKVKAVKGLSWGMAAISNAEWTGVRLVDVLNHCGIKEEDYKHIHFRGLDKDIEGSHYEASIPIETAMDPKRDVILAFEMNGKELPLDHGYPLRAIVPGTVGARQVKWVTGISASNEESQSHWQQKDYKTFAPSVDWGTAVFEEETPIQDYPIQSGICEPEDGATLPDSSEVTVKGYAWSGGGRGIIRLEVSADGGKTWHVARLQSLPQKLHRQWAWSLYDVTIPLKPGQSEIEIVCKAVDSSHNQQPETAEAIWNMRGLIHNAWHRIKVHVPQEDD